ncbi:TPA: DUF2971 domain-containing protein [Streptococcus suis]|nr:DUF2971 domain-containing protein [Streptococcus suis]HEM3626690.1 DUF2971 domain-containing protein [Streptococcus suis]HEM3639726.1 DUF2971 domain-containing protein [Streptococcus suis]HEM3652814.1 DUF2971 domain-containing protein [Streptococcus suis]HEM3656754.1 DUF2971 domain-containing protein [Streptococcus suis]
MSKTKIHIEKMETLLADLRARELEEKQPILEDLYKLYQEQPDETTALIYARGLLNLTVFQELSDCKTSVESLSDLSIRFPDISAIALVYAQSLFNLTVEQDLSGREHTVKELATLFSRFSEDSSIALEYAKGLVNLSAEQDLLGREQTVGELGHLSTRFSEDPFITLEYAKGLFNLTVKQDLEGCEQTVKELATLFSRFSEDSSTALAYAKGLVNLTVEQGLEGCERTVKELATLSSRFSEDSSIALEYAEGLVNLTVDQDLEGCKKTVEKLATLFSQFPADSAIALRYAKGLLNLSAEQDLLGCEQTVGELGHLSTRFSEDPFITLEYAKGLFNLTVKQDLEGCEQTAKELANLSSRFPDDSDIALVYAKGLVNLSAKQDLLGCEQTVGELGHLSTRFSEDSFITLEYAKGLVNLSVEKELGEQREISDKLEELLKQFPESIGIAEQTAWIQLIIGGKEEGKEVTKAVFDQALSYMNERFPKKHHSLLERFFMFFSQENEEKLCLLVETLLKPDFSNLLNGIEATTIIKATDCYFYTSENWANVQAFLLACKEQLSESKYAQWLDRIDKTENTDIEHLFKATKACKTILHLLRVNQKDLTHLSHYTALETLPKILLGEKDDDGRMIRKNGKVKMAGRYRFYNANYMNNPEEGKLLHKWLGAEEESVEQVSPFYLMSLTTESDHLPMWVQYGRDGKGICVTLHDDLFEVKNSRAEHELIARATDLKQQADGEEVNSQDGQKTSSSKEAERFAPYRICYMSDTNLYGNLFESDELEKIEKELANLKDIFAASSQKKEIYQIMEEIRFLFKSADYVTENEVRLLKYADLKSDKILLDETGDGVPRLYVEQGGHVKIKKITFGPKVYNESKIVPYIKFCDPEIEIGVSGIHFR